MSCCVCGLACRNGARWRRRQCPRLPDTPGALGRAIIARRRDRHRGAADRQSRFPRSSVSSLRRMARRRVIGEQQIEKVRSAGRRASSDKALLISNTSHFCRVASSTRGPFRVFYFCLRTLFGLRKRTPAPPPFSSMNKMSAASSASRSALMAASETRRLPRSKSTIVEIPKAAASASSA